MTAVDHLVALEEASDRISALIRPEVLGTRVDHLPPWKVRDVVAHLGGVHAWADRIVEHLSMDGPGSRKSKLDGDALCDWFAAGATALLARLRDVDPQEPCPNFNPGSEKIVAWWTRRQAHETTVHRWDIEQALGSTSPIEAGLAADGIDEFLDVFVRTRGKQTLASTLVIGTMESDHHWTLTPAQKPGRIDVAVGQGRADGPVTELRGEAESLLLALWGRRTAVDADLTISGDVAAAASLIAL